MKFIGDPYDLLGTLGPPTAFQPQVSGQGYKHYVFETSPVAHAIGPDGSHHQMIEVHSEDAHLPVERALLGYIRDVGYDAREFDLPEQVHWDRTSEQFGFPDTRPASLAQPVRQLPRDEGSFLPSAHGPEMGVAGRIRDASESELPRKGRF